jgi:hypothetical protein
MPPSLQGTSGGLGMPRFSAMRTRALSDDDYRHMRPASAGVSCSIDFPTSAVQKRSPKPRHWHPHAAHVQALAHAGGGSCPLAAPVSAHFQPADARRHNSCCRAVTAQLCCIPCR